MDIKQLISHQFNQVLSTSINEAPSEHTVFHTLCVRVKKLLETTEPSSVHERCADIVSTTMKLRQYIGSDISDATFADKLVAEKFTEIGVVIESLSESASTAVAIPAGEYLVRGRVCVWENDLLPIDECFGHPVYKVNGRYFILSEAKKKKVGEDAPVNSVGGGMIAGVSPGQEPPGPKGGFKALMMIKRKKKKSPQIDPMDGWPK